jgi:hypothetical protein
VSRRPNLHNLTQPLIRYELTDRFTRPHATPAAGWLRASIDGRADEVFRYGSVAVHPHVIRSALAGEAVVREYQVRQAGDGIEVACVTGGQRGRGHPHRAVDLEHPGGQQHQSGVYPGLTCHAPPATKMAVISAQSARYAHMTRRHRGGSLPSGNRRITSGRTRKGAAHSSAITTAAGPSGSLPPWTL